MPRLKVDLIVDDKGSLVVKNFTDNTNRYMHSAAGSVKGVVSALTSMQGLLAGAGAGFTAKHMLDTASSFEQMEKKLNALTEGRGVETLEAINAWALEMPVNTQKAVDTFVMMQAMGLNPTIDKMQTLVDVSSIFGEETMPRIAKAMGQMKTLGKLSAEELNQMSEAGINARKYLQEAFGMGVEELQKSGKEIDEIIKAITDGLDRDFGGAAAANMDSWKGITSTTMSYVTELERRVMDAGLFETIKEQLGYVNTELINWVENNDDLIKQKVPEAIEGIKEKITDLVGLYNSLPDGVGGATGTGLLTSILLGPKAGSVAALWDYFDETDRIINIVKGYQNFKAGNISFMDWATGSNEEIEAMNKALGKKKDAPISMPNINNSQVPTVTQSESIALLDAMGNKVEVVGEKSKKASSDLQNSTDKIVQVTEDAYGNITTITETAKGKFYEVVTDSFGNLISATDKVKGVVVDSYTDIMGRVVTVVEGSNDTIIESIQDSSGKIVEITEDANGNIISITNSAANSVSTVADQALSVISQLSQELGILESNISNVSYVKGIFGAADRIRFTEDTGSMGQTRTILPPSGFDLREFGDTVNNSSSTSVYFNQSVSRSDAANIIAESNRAKGR